MPEGINVPRIHKLIYPRTLFWEEAGIFFIFFWSSKVYLFMCSIHITAKYDMFPFFSKLVDIHKKCVIKFELVFKSLRTASAVREVDVQ